MNGKDSKHHCVACRVGSEGRAAASLSSSSFRPIPPRFRKKSDTVLPDARLCARHFQWLLRHFQEDKAQPHLRCLKKPPKRCVELLAGLARVGVNLVQPSESSSAAAGRVKVTQYVAPSWPPSLAPPRPRAANARQCTWRHNLRSSRVMCCPACIGGCTRPCCRRGCSAVQRHPIPKDVLPSVTGARVCRGTLLAARGCTSGVRPSHWLLSGSCRAPASSLLHVAAPALRVVLASASTLHGHSRDATLSRNAGKLPRQRCHVPHARGWDTHGEHHARRWVQTAAAAAVVLCCAPLTTLHTCSHCVCHAAPAYGDVSPSSAASSGSQVWPQPAPAASSQWADPGQASSQFGNRWPGPIPEPRGVSQGMYSHSPLHHSPIGHNHNQAHSAAYAAAALSTAYAQQVQAFYRTNPGYGPAAGAGGSNSAGAGGGVADGGGAGGAASASGSMGRPLQRGLSGLDMGVRDEVMGLPSPRGSAAPRGFGRLSNSGGMGGGQHGSMGAGGPASTGGYVPGFGARLAASSGVSVESMAVAPPAVPPRSFDSAVGLFGAPGRSATNGGAGAGLGFGSPMHASGAGPATGHGSPPARPATSAVAKATFTSAMGSGSVDLSTVRPDLLKRWGVEQHMHRVQSGNSNGSGHSHNPAKAKEIMSGWGSERSVVTVDSVNWSVSSKGSADMARAHPSLKSIFGNDPAVPDSSGGAGAERRLLSRGIPSAQSLLSQDVDMR